MNVMRYIKGLLCGLLLFAQFACNEYLDVIEREQRIVQVAGRITEFNDHTVSSRALKSEEESEIKTMSMFLFDNAGKCVDFQHVTSSSPLFVIDRTVLNAPVDDKNVSNATIYIMANVPLVHPSYEEEASYWLQKTENDLMARSLNVEGIDIPTGGFPMIGSVTANLELDGNVKDLLEIPLKHLYAKMVFNIKVNTTQQLDEFIPTFQMTGWEVHNVPTQVLLDNNEPNNDTSYHTEPIQKRNYTGNNPVSGSNVLSFSFYLPEHLLQSDSTITYPDRIKENEKQRFKPVRVKKSTKAPFVRIKGSFNDHQGHGHNLTYDIYLGKDNYENFVVERNYQYNNNVTITGSTNSIDGIDGSISVDHRVNVERNGYNIALERETLLDSHFEIRPIRVKIDKSAKVVISIIEPTENNWIRLEKKTSAPENDNTYGIDGKRLYFTNDLVSETLASSTSCEVVSDKDTCVWVYVDENIETLSMITDDTIEELKNKLRKAKLSIKYYSDGENLTSEDIYIFAQKYLYPVKSMTRKDANGNPYIYYIEFHEEYLHNYDSSDSFGETDDDGMSWGLNGEQLSKKDDAFVISSGNVWAEFIEWLLGLREFNPKYDFYINQAESADGKSFYPYSGRRFSNQIVSTMNIGVLPLSEEPSSAVEYCYNKNKRDKSGIIDTSAVHWYLPSIDELEDIVSSAYNEFLVFQGNFYWSSQPAYNEYPWSYHRWGYGASVTASGKLFEDNTMNARATKMEYHGANVIPPYSPALSGVKTPDKKLEIQYAGLGYRITNTGKSLELHIGNMPRTNKNRIRAVYKP